MAHEAAAVQGSGVHLTYRRSTCQLGLSPLSPVSAHTPHLGSVVGKTARGGACPGTTLPTATADDVRSAVLAERNPKGPTLGSTYRDCSYGQSLVNARNSLVPDIVELPCQGST